MRITILLGRAAVGAVLTIGAGRAALGQTAPGADRSEAPVCLGFSFGPWTPALDWRLAGHGDAVDSTNVPRAPGGRGWASPSVQSASASDTTLMLFPTW